MTWILPLAVLVAAALLAYLILPWILLLALLVAAALLACLLLDR